MGRKKKVQEEQKVQEVNVETLRKAILNYLQLNGWQIRKQFGLIDARLEENPTRLVLIATSSELKTNEFENLVHDGVVIPVEVQKVEMKPVVVTGDVTDGGKVEAAQEVDQNPVFHQEFSKQAKDVLNIKETVGPNATKDDVKGPNKEEALNAWKKRHSKVKIVGEK
ncbi:MAG: hypothetical protein WC516_07095 [Patescibacteria group bacterium]|jgi:hypothetical protein